MDHTFDNLKAQLRTQAGLEIDSYLERYVAAGGADDQDAFVSWLHAQHAITTEMFCQLHATGGIATAKYLGVQNHKTLLLETPKRTMLLPDGLKTVVAGAGAPTLVPVEIAEGSQAGRRPGTELDASGAAARNGNGRGARNAHIWETPRTTSTIMAPTPDADRPRYALLGCLGKGAMGEVHVARDEDLQRKVAYKRMVPEVAQSKALAARFFSEIQVTAQLDHPNIVPIYGLEVANDAIGYSMKLVQGSTLTKIVDEARSAAVKDPKGEPRRLARRLEIFLKVCDAIAYAHSKGVLHRDLKPDNIMVGRYHEVYVMDWGICRLIGAEDANADGAETPSPAAAAVLAASFAAGERTQYGAVLGTPAYMSPEQAAGLNHDLDGRSDQYALGLILQELVTLTGAVSGSTLEGVLERARTASRDPMVHVSGLPVPRELTGVVGKATARNPVDRYANVTAFADDLRRFLAGDAVLARPDTPAQRLGRWVGRHRLATVAAAAGVLVVGAAGVIGVLAHEKRALVRARVHEERLQAYVTAVEQQSHAIDDHLHRDEQLLAAMAGRAEEIVAARGAPGNQPVFLSEDYNFGHGPADMTDSSFYGRKVSFDAPVVKLAPGVSEKDVGADIKLAPALRVPLEDILLASATGGDDICATGIRDTQNALPLTQLRENGAPLLRAFVSLESGVHFSFPGMAGFPPEYDGRLRPKYRLAAHQHGVKWGNPYPDQFGHGLLLPMAIALYDDNGKFLGVAGADTTFRYLQDNLLPLAGHGEVEETLIVDEKGRVVVDSRDEKLKGSDVKQAGDLKNDEAIALEALGFPTVVKAIQERRSGTVQEMGKLVAFERLSSIGWYYVVVADPEKLVE